MSGDGALLDRRRPGSAGTAEPALAAPMNVSQEGYNCTLKKVHASVSASQWKILSPPRSKWRLSESDIVRQYAQLSVVYKFLAENGHKRSLERDRRALAMLDSFIGMLPLRRVHHDTLTPYIRSRLANGRSPGTINRDLAVVDCGSPASASRTASCSSDTRPST